MGNQSELISPSALAEMKAELESLSKTEPGAREVSEVVAELLPLIQGCRDRGHSWKRIAESLKKFHSDLTLSRLKRLAFELDPSLKGNAPSKGSLIPTLDDEPEDGNWPPEEAILDEPTPKASSKKKAIDFEDEL